MCKTRLDRRIRAALDATGLPWRMEDGSRHTKLKLAGHLVGIVPKGNGRAARETGLDRAVKNTVSQIRRKARELGR